MVKSLFFFVVAAIAFLSANGLGGHTLELHQLGKASDDWLPVTAQVTLFKAEPTEKHRRPPSNPLFHVEYTYQVDGRSYTGTRLAFGPYDPGELIRPDRKGEATVFYDPANPSNSAYIKGATQSNFYALLIALGVGVFGVIMVLMGLRALYRKFR
ncbi:MAG: DUF3592 domain-containing protein [Erythrobacter sp.]